MHHVQVDIVDTELSLSSGNSIGAGRSPRYPQKGGSLWSDVEAMLGACIAGAGIAQVMEIGVEQMMRDGLLVDIFPDWSDERFPLYALFPSRRHRAAKVEAFVSFCLESLSAASPVTRRQMSLPRERRQRRT
jgi:DNA-binding transcriptional LysR family regulator